MRFTITTGGARGDLQASLALGTALQGAGHQVRLATHFTYEDNVVCHGLEFFPVYGDPISDMRRLTADGQTTSVVSFARRYRTNVRASIQRVVNDYRDACQHADAVIYDYAGFPGYFVARALGLPSIGAFVEPLIAPTTEFRSPLMPPLPEVLRRAPFRGPYNRLSHVAAQQLFWQSVRSLLNQAIATTLRVEPIPLRGPFKQLEREREPAVFGFSPAVLGYPHDWPERCHVTGFWFLDDNKHWQPPPELYEFLATGPAPVCITLGSVIEEDPMAMTELLLEALRISGQRAILQTGWSGLGRTALPEGVLRVGEVPHHWLFPQVSAVVHHGGDGTTAAALRAGVPSVVVPKFHSQPFWASTVAKLGVGPEPIPRDQLSAQRLAQGIRQAATDERMIWRARELAESIETEDGVSAAVEVINEHLGLSANAGS